MQSLLFLAQTAPVSSDAGSGCAVAVLLIFLLLFGLLVWITPGLIANARRHHNRGAIWAVTLLAGWTFLGWLIAFVWAFTNPPPQPAITINNQR
jgi:hypothetical protein